MKLREEITKLTNFLFLIFVTLSSPLLAQQQISGRVVNAETGSALAYAKLQIPDQEPILTNIDGSFELSLPQKTSELRVSYLGYAPKKIEVSPSVNYLFIRLKPAAEELQKLVISSSEKEAKEIIRKAMERKSENDPEQALNSFRFRNYNKFVIDNSSGRLQVQNDSSSTSVETLMNVGKAYLSEKISEVKFDKRSGKKENVLALKTAGFEKPVYEMLSLNANPLSLYKEDYKIFNTDYAGPLSEDAFKNYQYKILDTTKTSRPAYVVYFKPKRPGVVAGLEGILYLDTQSYAIQKAKAELLGEIKLQVQHDYKYYPEEDLWFPSRQETTISAGYGGQEVSVFGGSISLGAVQHKNGILSQLLGQPGLQPDLFLKSTTYTYDVSLDEPVKIEHPSAAIEVSPGTGTGSGSFWKENRQEEFSPRDKATAAKVSEVIKEKDLRRKLEVRKALTTGHYPIGFFDFKLGYFFKFNNYEGIRLGAGGHTNERFSKKFSLGGFGVYGTKDNVWKYNLNTSIHLDKATGTNLNFGYTRDIREVGSFDYLTGIQDFSILEPRFVNINFFYSRKVYDIALQHRFGSKFKTELRLSHTDISQTKSYAYELNDRLYFEYTLAEAKFSFLWRPFSRFLRTPEDNVLLERNYPEITGEINKSFSGILDGDFEFTRFGLKIEEQIRRIDLSKTTFILEGDYAIGDAPLTQLFHSYPNNPRRDALMQRFAIAGRNSFETMYYNEFFSDRLLMLHIRHQLRPFYITQDIQPELVFITRFAIGDMNNVDRHKYVQFDTLDKGYSEAGIELNKILAGFGLSAAYRFGAYHLPTFNQNFALKFTFKLEL